MNDYVEQMATDRDLRMYPISSSNEPLDDFFLKLRFSSSRRLLRIIDLLVPTWAKSRLAFPVEPANDRAGYSYPVNSSPGLMLGNSCMLFAFSLRIVLIGP